MEEETFNDAEARFIASKIILERLNIAPKNINERITYSRNVKAAIKSIEDIEENWDCKPREQYHSFGRKEKDETVKLWSVPPMTANVLGYLALYTGAKNVLEIGTSGGYSTLYIANAIKQTDGRVSTIELLDEKSNLAKKTFNTSGLEEKINLIRGEASEVISKWNDGYIDFVFLDADKENYGKYFEQIVPLMSKEGIIVADNINDYGHMMQDYIQKVSGTHLPQSRCDSRVISTYVAQLDNGLIITKKL